MSVETRAEIIRSRQNKQIVRLCKLNDKKYRDELGLFRFDGVKLACEAIRKQVELDSVFINEARYGDVISRMKQLYGFDEKSFCCPVYLCDDALFRSVSEENSPDGIICCARHIDKIHKRYKIRKESCEQLKNALGFLTGPVIILESVRDPVNCGAIFRTAASLGIQAVILSDDCADYTHPRALRASMGGVFSLPVLTVDDLPQCIRLLNGIGYTGYAAALDETAARLGEVTLSNAGGRVFAVIGNEGHGLSPEVLSVCPSRLYIPMQPDCESLNASVAAALIMWEMRRSVQSV